MTLDEFVEAHPHTVAFWASVGTPTGQSVPLGHPDIEMDPGNQWLFVLLDLPGYVDSLGFWQWSGEGNPRDYLRNTITQVTAKPDREHWARLVQEWGFSHE